MTHAALQTDEGPRGATVVLWQRQGPFSGENVHRLSYRRLPAMLGHRFPASPPRVVFHGGDGRALLEAVLDPARPRPQLLILPTCRNHVCDQLLESLDLVDALADRAPDLPVVLAGWGADPDYLDAVRRSRPVRHPRFALARGEAEAALVDAIACFARPGPYPLAALIDAGLAVPDGAGGWLARGRYRVLPTLEDLPSPYASGTLTTAELGGAVMVEVTRGCPFRCRYCIVCNEPTRKVRPFHPEQVRADITYAIGSGATSLGLICAGLNYDLSMLRTVVESIEAAPPDRRPTVDSTVHPFVLDAERLDLLSRLPWNVMTVGLQSASPGAWAIMDRKTSLETFRRNVEALAAFTTPTVELILGLPGDTLEGFLTSLEVVLDLPVHAEVYTLRLSPGSPFFAERRELGLVADFGEEGRVVETSTFTAAELAEARDRMHGIAAGAWPHRARSLGFDFRPVYPRPGASRRAGRRS